MHTEVTKEIVEAFAASRKVMACCHAGAGVMVMPDRIAELWTWPPAA